MSSDLSKIPTSIDDFELLPCSRDIADVDFVAPGPLEVKALRNLIGFSQNDLAKFVGVTYNQRKGSTAVRKWETVSGNEARPISLSAWKLMQIKAGLIVVEVM